MRTPHISSLPADYALRVMARLDRKSRAMPSGCIEWTGALDRDGYGRIKINAGGKPRNTGTHRAAWLAKVGSIPAGFITDHLCRNRQCLNVVHMELVTYRVNAERGDLAGKVGRKKGTGGKGHSCGIHGREGGSERLRPDGYVYWACRICNRRRSKEYRERKLANA